MASSESEVKESSIAGSGEIKAKKNDPINKKKGETTKEKLFPTVAMYGPYSVGDLEPGKVMKWCTCGLSKKQPWCDGAHKGTGFKSLKWKVPDKPQKLYTLCGCKYTGSPPLCDGTHNDLPCTFIAQKESCKKPHSEDMKLCTGCGWVPDW